MCYNFQTSILSLLLGVGSSVAALITGQYMLGMLILFYSQMQLAEAIIWRGIDTDNLSLNRLGTSYGQYLLPTHNIAIGLGVILAAYVANKKLTWNDFIPVTIGIVFYLLIVWLIYGKYPGSSETYPGKTNCTRDCNDATNRLVWPFQHSWYAISFLISICFLWMYIKNVKSCIFLTVSFTALFLGSVLWYPRNVGSLFCFGTAIFAPIIVFVNWMIIK